MSSEAYRKAYKSPSRFPFNRTPLNWWFTRPYAFVSYANEDKEEVEAILVKLRNAHKLRYWYDQVLPIGGEFRGQLEIKIKQCDRFLLFLSDHSINSDNVRDEVKDAQTARKLIAVVKLQKEIKLPNDLSTWHNIAKLNMLHPSDVNFEDRLMDPLRTCCETPDTGSQQLNSRVILVSLLIAIAACLRLYLGPLNALSGKSNTELNLISPSTVSNATMEPRVVEKPAQTSELPSQAGAHAHSIDAWAFSIDGKLAIGDNSGSIKIWNINSPKLELMTNPWKWQTQIQALNWSPDSTRLAIATLRDFSVYPTDPTSGKTTFGFDGGLIMKNVVNVEFSPDGKTCCCKLVQDQFVRIVFVDTYTGMIRATLKTYSEMSPVYSIAYSPDGKTLATGHEDGEIRLWSDTGEALSKTVLGKAVSQVQQLLWSPGSKFLVSRQRGGGLKIWDVAERKEAADVQTNSQPDKIVAIGWTDVNLESQFPCKTWVPFSNREILQNKKLLCLIGSWYWLEGENRFRNADPNSPLDCWRGAISPDGKFILGSQTYSSTNPQCILMNVEGTVHNDFMTTNSE